MAGSSLIPLLTEFGRFPGQKGCQEMYSVLVQRTLLLRSTTSRGTRSLRLLRSSQLLGHVAREPSSGRPPGPPSGLTDASKQEKLPCSSLSKCVHLFRPCLLYFWEGKVNSNSLISVGVVAPYFDWGTESYFSFHKHENVKYITAKLIHAHKLVNYVNSESQNSVSLAFPLSSLGL